MRGDRNPALIGEHGQKLRHLRRTHVARMPYLPAAATPADEKTNPVKVSLLGFEAIVFVTKYLAHLPQQALGLGRMGDGVHGIKTCMKLHVLMLESKKSSGAGGLYRSYCKPSRQLFPPDKLGCQNIRRSTLRWA